MTKQKKLYHLEKNKVNLPYEVDQQYFLDLPQQIQSRVRSPQNKGISWAAFWKLGVAGTTALIALMFIFLPQISSNTVSVALKDITEQELLAYLQQEKIGEEDLYDVEDAILLALDNELTFSEVNILTEEELESVMHDPEYVEQDLDTEDFLEDLELEDIESFDF